MLRLSYDHNSYVNATAGGSVTASFDLLTNGVVTSTTTFSTLGTIFVGEDWTRVMLVGQSNQSESGVYKKAGTYGTLTLAQDGQWHYFLADHQGNVQALAQGQTATDTFTVQVSDGQGGTATRQIVETVTGVNDAPKVSAAVTASVAEGTGGATFTLLQNASDVDAGAVLHVANLVWTETGSGLPAGVSLSGNSLVVDTNNGAYDGLAIGQTAVAHFGYDVVDEHGGSVHQTATLMITGSNDAPVVSAAVTQTTTAGTGTQTENLLQNASDVDAGAVLHISNLVWTGGSGLPAGVTLSGDGNSLIVDTNNAAYASLTVGQSATAQFTYNVVDDQGAVAQQTATLTINGSAAALGISARCLARCLRTPGSW